MNIASLGFTALMGLTFGTIASPALADTQSDVPSITIHYTELDLSKPYGATALYGRIRQAAGSVCGLYPSRDLQRMQAWKKCYRRAVENAVSTVNEPVLTALHQNNVGPTQEGSSTLRRAALK